MKYRRIYIVILVLGFALWGAPTCDDPDPWENAQILQGVDTKSDPESVLQARKEIIEKIEKEFDAPMLQKENLIAFEERAKEKLMDFADYINIYTNGTYDEAFRNQAKKMVMDQFYGEVEIKSSIITPHEEDTYSLYTFMAEFSKLNFELVQLKIKDIEVSESLKYLDSETYTGRISFSRELLGISGQDSVIVSKDIDKIEIILNRTDKIFGNDTLKVWAVQLGNLY